MMARRSPTLPREVREQVTEAVGRRSVADAYLTLSEVAERYRAAEKTVRYWRAIGYGPRGVKIGTRVLYPLSEIERFDQEIADQVAAG